MTAQPPSGGPDATGAAVIPPHLVKLATLLIEFGAKDLTRRNGGPPHMPGLPVLRKILDASASATPSGTLEPPSRAPYTTSEAAKVMEVSVSRARYLAAAGRLIACKVGRDWLIDPDSAQDYRRKGTA